MTTRVHVSIGPVQHFIQQSRRTRDLWGGSYLLSFLSAHAMRGACEAGGTIESPRVDGDPMWRWIRNGNDGAAPTFGSIPNQFVVAVPDGTAITVADAARQALVTAWDRVCGAVYDQYVSVAAPHGDGTAGIWQRQIDSFWEIAWVEDSRNDRGLLSRRKHWRTHYLPEERGDKCTVITDPQELSGHVRARNRREQETFWSAVRQRAGEANIRDNERLCAVALVKRLFARNPDVAKVALGGEVDVAHWPSTVDVAAVPWLRHIAGDPVLTEMANRFTEDIVRLRGARKDILTDAAAKLIRLATSTPTAGPPIFLRLDANWFHRAFVGNRESAPLADESGRAALLEALDALVRAHPQGSPPIEAAILLADGDHLGKRIAEDGVDAVSRALARFTAAVPGIVQRHFGATIYAGGDDVLALLPVDGALAAARDIDDAFRASFVEQTATSKTAPSISVAVVFAHARDPLTRVLAEAHRLLDDVAKNANGRGSLAAGVYRGEATAVQWATTWKRASIDGDGHDHVDAVDGMNRLVVELSRARPGISGALVHDLQHTLGLLCGESRLAPGVFAELPEGAGPPEGAGLVDFLRAEVVHRLEHQDGDTTTASTEHLARLIANVLPRATNTAPGNTPSNSMGVDGLALASFLARGGREDETHR